MIVRHLVAALLCAAACTNSEAADAPPAAEATAEHAVVDDARDQYALLADIEAALGNGLDPDAGAMARVRSAWIGKRYRWEVGYVPVFCQSLDRCNVSPFDHEKLGADRRRQGFMPELALDEADFAAIRSGCADKPACVITIEGTMNRFAFSPEEATAIRFDDVAVHGARNASASESWIVSRARGRGRS